MRTLTFSFVISLILIVFVPAANANRYPVALTGDSIVESIPLRNQLGGFGSLGNLVNNDLVSLGTRVGGYGFLPDHSVVEASSPWVFAGDWKREGLFWFPASKSSFGADGLTSQTSDPKASASVIVAANRIAILYGRSPSGGKFKVSIDNKTPITINSRASTNSSGIHWINTNWAFHNLKIYNITGGDVRLAGIVASRQQTTLNEVEIDQLGHGGDRAESNLAPAQIGALVDLAPKLTIIMFGTNEEGSEMLGGGSSYRAKLTNGIAARGRAARRTGKCIVVPHAINDRDQALQAIYYSAARTGAKNGGCAFVDIFAGMWDKSSVSAGLTSDSIHPTTEGYARMSMRLAQLIKSTLPK